VLRVTSRGERLVAFGALQTSGVPILSHRRLLLREIDFFLTARTLWHFLNIFTLQVLEVDCFDM